MKREVRPAWAVVPAKCFHRGKSRLKPVLSDEAREELARKLFDHVLGVLVESAAFDGILVATDCEAVAVAARTHGARVRMDSAPAGLASVVDAALADVASRGAAAAIVFMADLPRIEANDVRELIAALTTNDVVAVTDVGGRHTNALGLVPPMCIATHFGRPDSFADHCTTARAAGLRLAVIQNERIAFDVDVPTDHARM